MDFFLWFLVLGSLDFQALSESRGLLSTPPCPGPSLMASHHHCLGLQLKDQPLSSIKINQHTGLCPFLNPSLPAAVVSALHISITARSVLQLHQPQQFFRSQSSSANTLPPVSRTHGGIYCLFLLLELLLRTHPNRMNISHVLGLLFLFPIVKMWKNWPKMCSCATEVNHYTAKALKKKNKHL